MRRQIGESRLQDQVRQTRDKGIKEDFEIDAKRFYRVTDFSDYALARQSPRGRTMLPCRAVIRLPVAWTASEKIAKAGSHQTRCRLTRRR